MHQESSRSTAGPWRCAVILLTLALLLLHCCPASVTARDLWRTADSDTRQRRAALEGAAVPGEGSVKTTYSKRFMASMHNDLKELQELLNNQVGRRSGTQRLRNSGAANLDMDHLRRYFMDGVRNE